MLYYHSSTMLLLQFCSTTIILLIYYYTITIDDSTQIYQGHETVASHGQFIYGEVKYIRITNLDADNSVVIHIEDSTNSHDAQFMIPAGHIFFLTDAAASYGSAAAIAIPTGNIERIDAMGSGGAVDIEILVASA